jgi:hypothetical protein
MNDVTNYECPVCAMIASSGHVCAMPAIRARLDTLTVELNEAREDVSAHKRLLDDMLTDYRTMRADRNRLAACVERVREFRDKWLNEDPSYCAIEREVTDVLRRQFDRALDGTDG